MKSESGLVVGGVGAEFFLWYLEQSGFCLTFAVMLRCLFTGPLNTEGQYSLGSFFPVPVALSGCSFLQHPLSDI